MIRVMQYASMTSGFILTDIMDIIDIILMNIHFNYESKDYTNISIEEKEAEERSVDLYKIYDNKVRIKRAHKNKFN